MTKIVIINLERDKIEMKVFFYMTFHAKDD